METSENDIIESHAKLLYDHLDKQIELADGKAQLILAASTFMAATAASSLIGNGLDLFGGTRPVLDIVASIGTLLMTISLLMTVYYALVVTKPTLTFPRENQALFYFGYIVRHSEEEFIRSFLSQSPEALRESVLAQIYSKSQIARRKFHGIRMSLNYLFATFALWAAVRIILAFVHQ